MIMISKRKLTSGVAILCAFMILIGIFPINLFTVRNAEAADGTRTIYFDTSGNGNWNGWNKSNTNYNMYIYAYDDYHNSGIQRMESTNIKSSAADGVVWKYSVPSNYTTVIFINQNVWGDKSHQTVNITLGKENCFYLDGGYVQGVGSKTVGRRTIIESLAGKTINFKDMTEKLTGDITAVFTGDGISGETLVNLNNGQVVVPADVEDKAYTNVEFKNGTVSLGKYNLFNESTAGYTAVEFDENTCNTFYYGATEKADNTKLSYWGAKYGTSSIANKTLYIKKGVFSNQILSINGKEVNSTETTVEENAVWSYTIPENATQETIITIESEGNTYHLLWDALGNDSVVLNTDLAKISERLSKLRVYFDATLSKLSYKINNTAQEGVLNDGKCMPDYNTPNDMYYYITNSSGTKIDSGQMTKDNTMENLWYVEIPEGGAKIRFAAWGEPSNENPAEYGDGTAMYDIPAEFVNPCFYADTSDDVIYSGGNRGGYWGELGSVRDAEKGKDTTVVDIPKSETTFTKDPNELYLNTTVYDWYSDYELNGNNRDSYADLESVTNHRIYQPFRQFNMALSQYYSDNSASSPLYWGNFQNYKGSHFNEIADTMNLYGYSDKDKFFYENNSMWGRDGSQIDNDGNSTSGQGVGIFATQGLVDDTLENGNLMIKTESGTVKAPYFDEEFINGKNSANTVLGHVYHNVAFPFTKKDVNNNGVDYWVFDSKDNKTNLRLTQDNTGKYFMQESNSVVKGRTTDGETEQGNYFPLNGSEQSGNAAKLNYGFANKFEFKFRLPQSGTVTDNNNKDVPVEFNFSGDDDVWIFIDGKLALDIGGGHGVVTGKLDFKNKTWYVSGVKKETGGGAYVPRTGKFTIDGSNTDEHTLTMFYMERGLWESNLYLSFNFPDENQLQVEKVIDTSDVNKDLLKQNPNLFDDVQAFKLSMKTLATHYGTYNDESQTTIEPIEFAKDFTGEITVGAGQQGEQRQEESDFYLYYKPSQDDDGSGSNTYHEHTAIRSVTFKADGNETKDISQMGRLQFDVNFRDRTPDIEHLYIKLTDSSDKIIDGFLDGKLIGTTTINKGTWTTLLVDLSKLAADADFNTANLKSITISYAQETAIYLDNFIFQPKTQVSGGNLGFVTNQALIKDYGSAASGKLENASGAQYVSDKNGNVTVSGDGTFYLENKETISFKEQFRLGSYIQLQENLTAEQKKTFTPYWTMYEDDVEVGTSKSNSSYTDVTTQTNLKDVQSDKVDDGRTEKREAYSVASGETQDTDNVYNGTKTPPPEGALLEGRPENTFVFRSYTKEDSAKTSTKLKLVYTNKIKVGNISITKENIGTKNINGTYTFYVECKDIAGFANKNVILGPYKLTLDNKNPNYENKSITITGIPVGTRYIIHEVKSSETPGESAEDANLDKIKLKLTGDNGKTINFVDSSLTVGGVTEDTIATSSSEPAVIEEENHTYNYTFSNRHKPLISLNVTKVWKDGSGNAISPPAEGEGAYNALPDSINFKLQRSPDKIKQNNTWVSVADENRTWEDVSSFALSKNNNWTIDFVSLEKYQRSGGTEKNPEYEYANENEKDYTIISPTYTYRVVELDADNNIINNNGTTSAGGKSYKVTYNQFVKDTDHAGYKDSDPRYYKTTITNTEVTTGELILEKEVTVDGTVNSVEDNDKNQKFDFNVTLSGNDINSKKDSIKYKTGTYGSDNTITWSESETAITWTAGSNEITATVNVSANNPVKIVGIPQGTTFNVEETVPNGYEQVISTYDDNNKTIGSDPKTVKITNKKLVGSLTITKVAKGSSNTKLSGAKFALYTDEKCGTKYKDLPETGSNGTATLSNIPYGTYYLKEEEAPAGYMLLGDTIEVTVNSSTVQLGEGYSNNQIENSPIVLPEAGGEGKNDPFNFVLFGAIAIALAGGILLLNKKYAFLHKGKSSKEVQ